MANVDASTRPRAQPATARPGPRSSRQLLARPKRPAGWIAALGALAFLSACAHRRPAPPRPYLAFVANQGSHAVSVVNLATFRAVTTLPVAAAPTRLVARPGKGEIWVVEQLGEATVIDVAALRVTATAPIGKSASDLFFSPDGDRFYAINGETGAVTFGEGEPGKIPRASGPALKAVYRYGGGSLTRDGKTLILSDAARNCLVFVDTGARKILGRVATGRQPQALATLPDGSKVFVADGAEDAVSVVDVPKRQLLSNLEIGTRPGTIILKPDGGELFVLAQDGGIMTIVDAFHDDVEETFPIGRNPAAGLFRNDSGTLYVASAGDGSVTAIDVANRAVLNSTQVGGAPRALALTPDERFLVAACPDDGSIAVLRAAPAELTTKDSALITKIPTGVAPVDVIIPNLGAASDTQQSSRRSASRPRPGG
jgi:YVTN family beta-propeller protein